MRDLQAELKVLRLHGMAQRWMEMLAQGTPASIQAARVVIEQHHRRFAVRQMTVGTGHRGQHVALLRLTQRDLNEAMLRR